MIPHVIHQTWKDERVRESWIPFQQSWRKHHPSWEYRFYTDVDLREMIQQHYAWFLPTYDGYPTNIMRVDAARYFLMHRCGGLYVDLDFESLRPIDSLLANRQLVFGCEPQEHVKLNKPRARGFHSIVCNAFIASAPEHPFWEYVFEQMTLSRLRPDPLDATGPFFMTRAIFSYPRKHTITLLPSELLYPIGIPETRNGDTTRDWREQAFAIHHWAGSWWR